jgi:hypothetical protein
MPSHTIHNDFDIAAFYPPGAARRIEAIAQ